MDGAGLGKAEGKVGGPTGGGAQQNCKDRWRSSLWKHRAGASLVAQVVTGEATEELPFELSLVITGNAELVCRGRGAFGRDTGGSDLGDPRGRP